MTLDDLLADLETFPPETPLLFRGAEGPIRGGYHLTEFKHADIASIDCGGRTDRWRETVMQLLDGRGGAPMTVDRFRRIARQSRKALPGLGAAPLRVEFASANDGLRLHRPARPEQGASTVVVPLSEERALCKPAQAAGRACCG